MRQTAPSIRFFCVAVAALSIAVATNAVAHADMLGYWTFDGDLLDSSGLGNDGAPDGDPMFDGDVPAAIGAGQSLAFDGDDLVNVTQNSGLPLSTQPGFTVSMWVKGAAQSDKRVFSEGSTADGTPLFNLGTDNTGSTGAFDLFVRADSGTVGTPASHLKSESQPFDDTWHNIVYVDDGGNARLYVDGVMDPASLNYARGPLTLDTTTIGGILRSSSCCQFTGKIDDAAIWNSLLTEDNIADLAAGTSPASITAPDPPAPPAAPQIGDVFMIDVDTRVVSDGSDTGPISTADGWVSLDATRGNGATVRDDAINFSIGSADGSLQRSDQGVLNPNPLTGDFAFDDVDDQAAVIMFFGRAGDLPAGTWQVDVYTYDADVELGPQILAIRTDGVETVISESVMPNADEAAFSFQFESDGVAAYDIFLRENNEANLTRLNAVRLTYLPEPSSVILLGLGMLGLLAATRRRSLAAS